MKNILMFLLMILVFTSAFAGDTDSVEGPKICQQCGMDRTAFAQSRMLVLYADGSSVGVCSLYCTAAELHHHSGKQVKSLMVADYYTKKLLDARTATWVVGGKISGVMTALPKWAFAGTEGARKFVKENGGVVTSFDEAMKSSTREVVDQAAEERAVERELLHEQQ